MSAATDDASQKFAKARRLLAEGYSYRAAASAAGVSRNTLSKLAPGLGMTQVEAGQLRAAQRKAEHEMNKQWRRTSKETTA